MTRRTWSRTRDPPHSRRMSISPGSARTVSFFARRERGVSLIELLVLLLILGLLLLIAAPSFQHTEQTQQDNDTRQTLVQTFQVLRRISNESSDGSYPATPQLVAQLKSEVPGISFVQGLPLQGQWPSTPEIGVESDGNQQVALCSRAPGGSVFSIRIVGINPNAGVYFGGPGNGCTDGSQPATPGVPPAGPPAPKGENETTSTNWIDSSTATPATVYAQPPTLSIGAGGYPSNAPTISGNPGDTAGGTLSVSNGGWDPRWPPTSYSYRWWSCTQTLPQQPAPMPPNLPQDNPALCVFANGSPTNQSSYTVVPADLDTYLYVSITATTAEGASTTVLSQPFRAANPPANATLPSITDLRDSSTPPATVKDEDMLQGNVGSWNGTLPFNWTYQWQRCNTGGASCVAIAGATASTYRVSYADIGSTIRFAATATNPKWSDMTQTATSPATVIVATNPPQAPADGSANAPQTTDTHNVSVVDSSVPHAVDDTFTSSTGNWGIGAGGGGANSGGGTDSPTDPLTYSYQWQRCSSSSASSCVNIPGATASSYTPTTADVGMYDRVCVKATNSAGSATSCSAPIGPIVDKPRNAGGAALPTVPGGAGAIRWGTPVSAVNGSWTGTPTIGYGYQWQRCDNAGNNCVAIAGATSQSYTPGNADVGSFAATSPTLRVVVSATNTYGTTSATSPASSPVYPAAPTNTGLPTESGSTTAGQTLTATNGTWNPNGAGLSYSYQWQACNGSCSNIPGATGSSYTVSEAYTGQTIRVAVSASNWGGSTTAYSNQSASVAGYTPSVSTGGVSYSQGSTDATLYGTVNDPGAASTNWSFTLGTGAGTVSGPGASGISGDAPGLAYSTTYSYQACASNPWGSACGATQSFTTSPPQDCDLDFDGSSCATNVNADSQPDTDHNETSMGYACSSDGDDYSLYGTGEPCWPAYEYLDSSSACSTNSTEVGWQCLYWDSSTSDGDGDATAGVQWCQSNVWGSMGPAGGWQEAGTSVSFQVQCYSYYGIWGSASAPSRVESS